MVRAHEEDVATLVLGDKAVGVQDDLPGARRPACMGERAGVQARTWEAARGYLGCPETDCAAGSTSLACPRPAPGVYGG